MAISGIGVITSGLGGTRPDQAFLFYSDETDIYQLPIPTASNMANANFKVSESEEKRLTTAIENQLVGISRAHWAYNSFVTFDGVFFNKSNHPANNIIVSVSGIEAYINNTYVGALSKELVWSGLQHSGPNYLWLNLTEESTDKFNYKSSVQFRDVETRFNNSVTEPIQGKSVLVGTYTSGIGFNTNPWGKLKQTLAKDHVSNNQNPHGTRLLQDYILTSGISIIDSSAWDYTAAPTGPALSALYGGITYLQHLTQQGLLHCSGILGTTLSGNLAKTFFANITNLEADPATVGNMTVISGAGISGTFFRGHLRVSSGLTVDGLDFTTLIPLGSQTALSGGTLSHRHALILFSGTSVMCSPKYPNTILFPPSIGRRTDKVFEYNTDFGTNRNTLRFKANTVSGNIFIRTVVPSFYNELESVQIEHKIDSGSPPPKVYVRDCVGTLHVPRLGSTLTSGVVGTTLVSGMPQAGFSQNMPFDLEIALRSTSGLNQYFGNVIFNFRASRN